MSDWSSLTEPLLLSILCRLDTLDDFYSFRGVCRSWRALAAPTPESLASQNPLLLLTHFPALTEVVYDIVRGRLYRGHLPTPVSSRDFMAYAHGYLVIVDDPNILLWNIFTQGRIRLPKVPQMFDRVLLSSRPSSPGCLVVLFGGAFVQYLHIGDSLWRVVDCYKQLPLIYDMIFFKNKLYALSTGLQLIIVDLVAEPKYEVLRHGKDSKIAWRIHGKRFLAVSGEELLAICYKREGGFDIFRWDFRSNDWERKFTLDGRALFMGDDCFAGSVDASKTGLRGDCIYSLGYLSTKWSEFTLRDQLLRHAYPPRLELFGELDALPHFWVFPSIC